MTDSHDRHQFAEDGFLIARGYLTPEEILELEANLQRYIDQIAPTVPPSDVFYEVTGRPETLKQMQLMEQYDPFFQTLKTSSRLLRTAEALLGMPVLAQQVEFFNKPAQIGKPTPPHQDGFYFCLTPSEALTLWFPLDVVNEENGCIRYVPGSHKKGIRPHNASDILGFSQGLTDWSPEDEASEVKATAAPGDLLSHHCDTIHRADPNLSLRSRRAIAIVYNAACAVRDEKALARYARSQDQQRIKLQST